MLFKPNFLIIPILSILLVLPEAMAYPKNTYANSIAYGRIWLQCSRSEYTEYGCECIADCYAYNHDDTTTSKAQQEAIAAKCYKQCNRFFNKK